MNDTATATSPAGDLQIGELTLGRLGYGTMQLPGPGVMGPPADHDAAVAVLREALALGVRHFDTADFYGPGVSNALLREALDPSPDDVVIVTKVGSERDSEGAFLHAREADDVRAQVERNLTQLGVDRLDVVNLRLGGVSAPEEGPLPSGFDALVALQEEGVIRHLGLSEVTEEQYRQARSRTEIFCVQSHFNLVNRDAEPLVRRCEADGVAFVAYFPLGGFSSIASTRLDAVAAGRHASPQQVALAWLLQHSSTMAVIPGTNSLEHLRDNVGAASLHLGKNDLRALDGLAG